MFCSYTDSIVSQRLQLKHPNIDIPHIYGINLFIEHPLNIYILIDRFTKKQFNMPVKLLT